MRHLSIIFLAVVVLFSACKTEDNNVNPSSGGNNNSGVLVTGVNWRVSYFYDNDKDETSDFSGYTFEFRSDNTLVANNGSNTISGTWNETVDDNLPRLVMQLNTTNDKLDELNDDWVIESKTASEIKLKDDNPDRNEQLHFTKL